MSRSCPDPVEEHARRCIELTLGAVVECYDIGGRQGAHDLQWVDPESRVVAAEVKQDVDPDYRALARVVRRTGYVLDDRLTALWDVRLERGANHRRVLKAIPELLVQLEAAGETPVPPLAALRFRTPQVAAELDALRVVSVWNTAATQKHPPGFYVMPAPWSTGDFGSDELVAYVCERLADGSTEMQNLRGKLTKAHADERHAFLILGWELPRAVPPRSLSVEPLPAQPPALPAPIDGVWITGSASDARLIAWLPRSGWMEGRRPDPDD